MSVFADMALTIDIITKAKAGKKPSLFFCPRSDRWCQLKIMDVGHFFFQSSRKVGL